MTTFPAFASSFGFVNLPAVGDVQDIIDGFRTEALAQTPAWTEPVAETFESPVDADGRFYRIAMVATTQFRLGLTVTDQNGITIITREIDIDNPGPTSVNIFVGEYHAFIESLTATPELFQSGILDETPQSQVAIQNYVYAGAYRNSGGGVDGQGGIVNVIFMLDNGAPAVVNRYRSFWRTEDAQIGLTDVTGALQFFPCEMKANTGGVTKWIGRAYQCWLCDSSLSFSSQKTVQIGDSGETGVFQVIGLTSVGGVARQMVRVA